MFRIGFFSQRRSDMRRTGTLLTLALLALGCGPNFHDRCLLELAGGVPQAAQVGTALHLGEASEAALGIVKGVVR
jgi:hypothetical protein